MAMALARREELVVSGRSMAMMAIDQRWKIGSVPMEGSKREIVHTVSDNRSIGESAAVPMNVLTKEQSATTNGCRLKKGSAACRWMEVVDTEDRCCDSKC